MRDEILSCGTKSARGVNAAVAEGRGAQGDRIRERGIHRGQEAHARDRSGVRFLAKRLEGMTIVDSQPIRPARPAGLLMERGCRSKATAPLRWL